MTIKIQQLDEIKTSEQMEEGRINGDLFMAYINAKRANAENLNFDVIYDYKNLSENLERFEIKEITITDQSTRLMRSLQKFTEAGFKMNGMTEINGKPAILLTK